LTLESANNNFRLVGAKKDPIFDENEKQMTELSFYLYMFFLEVDWFG